MSAPLYFDGKKYISSKQASELTGYAGDYIGQLCRGGKIDSKRIGRNWFVCEKEILKHKESSVIKSGSGSTQSIYQKLVSLKEVAKNRVWNGNSRKFFSYDVSSLVKKTAVSGTAKLAGAVSKISIPRRLARRRLGEGGSLDRGQSLPRPAVVLNESGTRRIISPYSILVFRKVGAFAFSFILIFGTYFYRAEIYSGGAVVGKKTFSVVKAVSVAGQKISLAVAGAEVGAVKMIVATGMDSTKLALQKISSIPTYASFGVRTVFVSAQTPISVAKNVLADFSVSSSRLLSFAYSGIAGGIGKTVSGVAETAGSIDSIYISAGKTIGETANTIASSYLSVGDKLASAGTFISEKSSGAIVSAFSVIANSTIGSVSSVSNGYIALGDNLANTGTLISEKAGKAVVGISSSISTSAIYTKDSLASAVSSAGGVLSDSLVNVSGSIGNFKGGKLLSVSTSAFSSAVNATAESISSISNGYIALGDNLATAGTFVSEKSAGAIASAFSIVASATTESISSISNSYLALGDNLANTGTFISEKAGEAVSSVNKVVYVNVQSVGNVFAGARSVSDFAKAPVASAKNLFTDFSKASSHLLSSAYSGIAGGIGKTVSSVAEAIGSIGSISSEVGRGLSTLYIESSDKLSSSGLSAGSTASALADSFYQAGHLAGNIFVSATQASISTIGETSNTIASSYLSLGDKLASAGTFVSEKSAGAIASTFSVIANSTIGSVSSFSNSYLTLGENLSGAGLFISQKAGSIVAGVSSSISSGNFTGGKLLSVSTSAFSSAVNSTAKSISSISNGYLALGDNLANTGTFISEKAGNAITQTSSFVANTAVESFSSVSNSYLTLGNSLADTGTFISEKTGKVVSLAYEKVSTMTEMLPHPRLASRKIKQNIPQTLQTPQTPEVQNVLQTEKAPQVAEVVPAKGKKAISMVLPPIVIPDFRGMIFRAFDSSKKAISESVGTISNSASAILASLSSPVPSPSTSFPKATNYQLQATSSPSVSGQVFATAYNSVVSSLNSANTSIQSSFSSLGESMISARNGIAGFFQNSADTIYRGIAGYFTSPSTIGVVSNPSPAKIPAKPAPTKIAVNPPAVPPATTPSTHSSQGSSGSTATTPPTTIIERTIIQPAPVVAVASYSRGEVDTLLNQLNNALSSKIYAVSASGTIASGANTTYINNVYNNAVAPMNRIDSLTNLALQNPTVTGGTFTGGSISGSSIIDSTFTGSTGTFTGNITGAGTLAITGDITGGGALNISGAGASSFAGSLGIGTTSPYAKLSVVGPVVAEYFHATSTTATSTFAGGINVAGTSGLTVLQNGKVGLGTAAPTYKFDVRSTTGVSQLHFSSSNVDSGGYLTSASGHNFFMSAGSMWNGSSWVAKDTTASAVGGSGVAGGDLTFYTNSGLTPENTFSPTVRMVIQAGGNVGVGSSTPSAKLSVTGTGQTTGRAFVISDSANVERLTVLDNGNVGIGTAAPAVKLDVQTLANDWTQEIINNAVAGQDYASGLKISLTNNTNVLGTGLAVDSGGLRRFVVQASGNVGIGTTSPYSKLSVAGQVVAQNYVATSTDANYFMGNVGIGSSSPMSALSVVGDEQHYGNYYHFGSVVSPSPCFSESCIELWGNDNTTGGVTSNVGNTNSGTSAFSGYSLFNNIADGNNSSNFAGLYLNSSTYNDTSFGTANAVPYQIMLQNSMGGISIQAGTSTSPENAYINFLTDGFNTVNEKMRITALGNVGIGLTNPSSKLEVNGDIRITTASGGRIFFADGSSMSTASIAVGSGITSYNDLNFQTGGAMNFQTGNGLSTTTKLFLGNGGSLGIGVGNTNPNYTLDVTGNARFTSFVDASYFVATSTTATSTFAGLADIYGNLVVGNFASASYFNATSTTATSTFAGGMNVAGTTGLTVLQNGKVGIGTTAPGYTLDIQGASAAFKVKSTTAGNRAMAFLTDSTGSRISYFGQEGSAGGEIAINTAPYSMVLASNNAYPLHLGTDDTVRMTILPTSGNVGIGTTTPANKLTVYGSSDTGPATTGAVPNGVFGVTTNNGNSLYIGGYSASPYGIWLQAQSRGSQSLNYPIVLNPNGGNVGIGTTSPGAKLDLVGGLHITGTATFPSSGIGLEVNYAGVAAGSQLQSYNRDASAWIPMQLGASNIQFNNSGTEAMRITGGNVGIGTTSPATKLDVYGSAVGSNTLFTVTNTGSDPYVGDFALMNPNLTTGQVAYFAIGKAASTNNRFSIAYNHVADGSALNYMGYTVNGGSSVLMALQASGNVGIGTTTPGALLHLAPNSGVAEARITTQGDVAKLQLQRQLTGVSNWSIRAGASSATEPFDIYDEDSSLARLTITNSGLVGIGTTSPASKLHIYENGSNVGSSAGLTIANEGVGDANLNFLLTGTQRWQAGIDNSDSDSFKISHTDFSVGSDLTITTGGSVGIGTTDPNTLLQIQNGFISTYQNTSGAGAGYGIQSFTNTTGSTKATIGEFGVMQQTASTRDGYFYVKTANTGAPTEKFRITNDGNVGIGTTTPSTKLQVYGTGNVLHVGDSTDGVLIGQAAGLGKIVGSDLVGYNDLDIRAQAGTQLYLSTSGNVGIGTTTPVQKLDVFQTGYGGLPATTGTVATGIMHLGTQGTNDLYFGADPNSPYGTWIQSQKSTNLATNYPLLLNPNGGNVGIGTTSPQSNLHVYGSGTTPFYVDVSTNGPVYENFRVKNVSKGYIGWTTTGSTGLSFLNAAGTTANMLVTDAGNVGIGTTTPASPLHVYGSTTSLGTGPATARFTTTSDLTYNWGSIVDAPNLTAGHIIVSPFVGRDMSPNNVGYMGFKYSSSGSTDNALTWGFHSNDQLMTLKATGNVGIGTTSPSGKLHVVSGSAYTDTAIFERSGQTTDSLFNSFRLLTTKTTDMADGFGTGFAFNIQDNAGVISALGDIGAVRAGGDTTGDLVFRPALASVSTERMRITSTGNVGIGTTSPSAPLTVSASDTVYQGQLVVVDKDYASTNVLAYPLISGYGNDINGLTGRMWALGKYSSVSNDTMLVNSISGGNIHLITTGLGNVLIDNGNVGVGTTSPSAKLSITGTGQTTGRAFVISDSANVERLTVLDNGNVGIGTANPTDALTVNGNIKLPTLAYIGYGSAGTTPGNNDYLKLQDVGVGTPSFQFVQDGSTKFVIEGNTGNIGIGTTSPYAKLSVVGETVSSYFTATTTTATSTFAGGLTVGTNKLVVNNFNGNVGIGTTNPVYALNVDGSDKYIAITQSGVDRIKFGNASGFGGFFAMSDNSAVQTVAVRSYTVSGVQAYFTAGNVGIGTTSPYAKLSIATAPGADGSQSTLFNIASSTATATTSLFTVLANGNVGVGTASPTTQLNVVSPNPTTASSLQANSFKWNGNGSQGAYTQANAFGNYASWAGTVSGGAPNYYGMAGINNNVNTSNSAYDLYYMQGIYNIVTNSNAGLVSNQYGLNNQIQFTSTGNTTNAYGVMTGFDNSKPSGAVTNVYGTYMGNPTGTGSYTNVYGLYLENLTKGTALNYSIYSAGGTMYHAGNVGIGTTSPATNLSVAGNGYFTNAVGIGAVRTSAGLYTSALTIGNLGACNGSQGLQTDASGNVSCGNITTSSISSNGVWNSNDTLANITEATTTYMVGIGATTSPYAMLSVISGFTATTTFSLTPATSQTANIFDIYNTSGALHSVFTAGGKFGIGSTTPWAQLSVNPNGITGPAFAVGSSTATNFVVTNGGNVGIGTAVPETKLHLVIDDNNYNPAFTLQNINSGANARYKMLFKDYTGAEIGGWEASRGAVTFTSRYEAGEIYFSTKTSGAFNTRLTVSNLGNVGIGTTSPYAKLSVAGSGTGTGTAFAISDVSSTTRMVVLDNGNVGIGTANPGYTLDVNGSVNMGNNSRVTGGTGQFLAGTISQVTNGTLTLSNQTSQGTANNIAVALAYLASFTQTSGNNRAVTITPVYNQASGVAANTDLLINRTETALGSGTQYLIDAQAGVTGGVSKFNVTNTGQGYFAGNVGIGTTSPYAKLSIHANNGDTNSTLFNIASSTATATTSLFTVLANGNVGVGTATPAANLEVNGGTSRVLIGQMADSSIYSGFGISSTLTTSNAVLFAQSGGSTYFQSPSNTSIYLKPAGGFSLAAKTSGGIAIGNTYYSTDPGANNVIIQGNVGIGTTSPYAKLSISGNASDTYNSTLFAIASSTNGTATTTAFTVLANGSVGIGTAAPSSSFKLDIAGSARVTTNVYFGTSGLAMGLQPVGYGLYSYANDLTFYTYDGVNINNNLIVKATTGNIGIGTSSPYAKLSVVGETVSSFFTATTTTATSTFAGGMRVAGTTGLTVLQNGSVGVGTDGTVSRAKFEVSHTPTDGTIDNYGIRSSVLASPSADSTKFVWGGYMTAQNVGAKNITGAWGTGGLVGMYMKASNDGVGNVTNAYAMIPTVQNTGIGTTTNAYALYIPNGYTPAGGITNYKGLYIDTPTVGTATNFPLYVAGGNSYFGGNVGIGTTTPSGALEVYSANYPVARFTRTAVTASSYITANDILGKTSVDMSDGMGSSMTFSIQDDAGVANMIGQIGAKRNGADNTGDLWFQSRSAGTWKDAMIIKNDGNVGIGTTNPLTTLHVSTTTGGLLVGVGNSYEPYLQATNSGRVATNPGYSFYSDTDTGMFNPTSSGSIAFSNNGAESMRINSSGNVGIGTTTPDRKLNVYGGNIGINNSSAPALDLLRAGSDTDYQIINNAAYFQIRKATDGTTWSPFVTVDYNGNVGIGTTTPAKLLDVNGNIRSGIPGTNANTFVTDTTNKRVGIGIATPLATLDIFGDGGVTNMIRMTDNAYGTLIVRGVNNNPNYGVNISSDGLLSLSANSAEVMRLTSAGNVGIGSTSPATNLSVAGNGYFTNAVGIGAVRTSAGLYTSALTIGNLGACNGSQGLQTDASGNVSCGNITTSSISSNGVWNSNDTLANITEATTTYMVGIGATTSPYAMLSVISGFTATTTFSLTPATSQTANIFDIYNTSGALHSVFTAGGKFGIGSTTPWAQLSVNPNGVTGPAFAVGSSTATNFVVTNGGNVGIGTAAPVTKLDVGMDGSGESINSQGHMVIGSNYALFFGGFGFTGGTYLRGYNTSQLAIGVNGAERMRFDSTGNVGIGTTSPYAKLSVVGPVVAEYFNATSTTATSTIAGGITVGTSKFVVNNFNGKVGIGTANPSSLFTVYESTNDYTQSQGNSLIQHSSNNSQSVIEAFGIGTADLLRLNDNTTPVFVVKDGGNVGIGTTSPTYKFTVSNSNGVDDYVGFDFASGAPRLKMVDLGGVEAMIYTGNYGGTDTRLNLGFNETGKGALLSINYSGSIGIGTTSPYAKLSIQNGGLPTDTYNPTLFAIASSTNGTATTTAFTVLANGNVGVGTASPSTALDIVGGITQNVTLSSSTIAEYGITQNVTVAGGASDLSGAHRGINTGITITGSGGATNAVTGLNYAFSNYNTGTMAALYGASGTINNQAVSGTVTLAAGLRGNIAVRDAGNITTGASLLAASPVKTSTGNIVNQYGLYINNQGLSGSTVSSGIYVDAQSGATNSYAAIFAGGNVGIGTTTPATKLDVLAGVSGDGEITALTVRHGGGSAGDNTAISFRPASGWSGMTLPAKIVATAPSGNNIGFNFVTNNVGVANTAMSILSTGNIGIGTTSPFAKLSIHANNGETNTTLFNIASSTATATTSLFTILNTGNTTVGGTFTSTGAVTASNGLTISTGSLAVSQGRITVTNNSTSNVVLNLQGASGQTADYIKVLTNASVNLFNVDAGGRIGIGTSSPYAKLSISGNASDTYNPTLFAIASSTSGTATTTAFTVLANGNVGVGTASPGYKMEVIGTFRASSNAYFDASVLGDAAWFDQFRPKTVSGALTFRNYAGETKMTLLDGGNVGVGTTSPYAKLSVVGETVSSYFTATTTTATSTFAGGFSVGGGALNYDFSSGLTSVSGLQLSGAMNFDTDAGMVSWVDMPQESALLGTVQGYSANLASTPVLTVFGLSDGNGGIASTTVIIGATSTLPSTVGLTIWGNDSLASTRVMEVANSASTTLFSINNGGAVTMGGTTSTTTINGYLDILGTGANSTSTIASNLWVKGSLRASVSYTGDLFFANNFSFAEAPMNASSTQGILLRNQEGKDVFTVDQGGNLSLVGDVCYKGKQCFGKSIDSLTNDLVNLASTTSNLLFSAQATTTASLSELTVSQNNLSKSLVDLNARVDALSSTTISLASSLASSTTSISELLASTTAMNSLASSTADILLGTSSPNLGGQNDIAFSFITRVANAVIDYIKSATDLVFAKISSALAVFTRVETQTASVTKGLEMTDQATGQIYCVTIKNGEFDKQLGACGQITQNTDTQSTNNTQTNQNTNGTATSSPSVSSTNNLPVITLLGNNPAEITLGSTFIDPGATATDSAGESLMPDIIENTVNTSVVGEYKVVWEAHDSQMNTATSTRIVNVVEPNPATVAPAAGATDTASTTPEVTEPVVPEVVVPVIDEATSTPPVVTETATTTP